MELDINTIRKAGMPLLSYCLRMNYDKADIQWLLDHGADPNQIRNHKTPYGTSQYTALDDAISYTKSPEILRLLLERGADVSAKTLIYLEDGTSVHFTPLCAAVMLNLVPLVQILLEYGADPNIPRVRHTKDGDRSYHIIDDAIHCTHNDELVNMLKQAGAEGNGFIRSAGFEKACS